MKLNKEKYLNLELGLTVIFFIYYLFLTFQSSSYGNELFAIYFHIVVGYTIAIILLVLLMLFITKSKSIENDERDKLIESKAHRAAYIFTISAINIIVVASLIFNELFEPFIIFNILFTILFISHIILNVTQLFYYKRGI